MKVAAIKAKESNESARSVKAKAAVKTVVKKCIEIVKSNENEARRKRKLNNQQRNGNRNNRKAKAMKAKMAAIGVININKAKMKMKSEISKCGINNEMKIMKWRSGGSV
jgi:DUF438 domain-containing protein